MTELPLFNQRAKCHGTAEAIRSRRMTVIRTQVPSWSYAVSYPRDDSTPAGGTIIVRIAIQVLKGKIGVGCLNRDGSAYLDETVVSIDDGPTVAEVIVVDASELGELILRNVSEDGSSEAWLTDITYSPVDANDTNRAGSLSAPRPMPRWSRFYGSKGDDAVERVRALRFETLREPQQLEWADGLRLVIQPGEQLSRALYVSSTYEPNTLAVLRALTPSGGVFVDVGANVGVVSLAAAVWVGATGYVFAFEPSQREYQRLTDNLLINECGWITPIRAAVIDHEGDLELRVADAAFGGLNTTASAFSYSGVAVERVERVPGITLDAFLSRTPVPRVDVIKIDVEGVEGTVLTGAAHVLQAFRPAVVLEVFSHSLQSAGWDRARLTGLLHSAGYALFAIDDMTARLAHIAALDQVDEENVVAIPNERVEATLARINASGEPASAG